jgi:hypothetical protein
MRRIKFILSTVPVLILAGCLTPREVPSAAVASPPPANYKSTISARIKQSFFDPYSLRDVKISQPFAQQFAMVGGPAWWVCVRANGKNRLGGYVGLRDTAFAFDGDRIDDFKTGMLDGVPASDSGTGICGPARWEPWPEMEGRG